ncbi:NAD-dependent epimerase/dehydratase family protein [Candidatus Bathyarchaeota archaeon]|nr:MAG: NAD-dependent epimerase/dehydratase family protein [Candidatus Bathyarchaeota archaeon]
METRTVLVTGGAGFMGSWLVDELVKKGHQVVSADNLLGGSERNVNKDCKFVKADMRIRDRVKEVVKGTDIIFHLAAYAAEGQSFFSPVAINEINIVPMNNLLVEAINKDVESFVFTSSMAVYGAQKPPFREDLPREPEDPYGAAKAYCETMLEIFAHTYGLHYTILRPHNVYGPRQNTADPYRNVLGIWINRILRNKPPLIYGNGDQTRAFSYVEDVTPAIANAAFHEKTNMQIINIGSDEITPINDACRALLETMHSEMEPIYEPARPGEVKHAYCTVRKSMDLLDYKTSHTLKQGLSKMVDWARDLGPQEPTYRLPLEITRKAPRVWVEKLM